MDEIKEPEKQQSTSDVKSSPEKIPDVKDGVIKRKFRWEIIIAIATVAYVIVSYLMWDNMKQQIDLTKESLSKTDSSIELTKRSLSKTDSSLNLTKKSIAQMIESNRIQSSNLTLQIQNLNMQKDYFQKTIRPYMYYDSLKIEYNTSYDTIKSIQYVLKNCGQIVAKELRPSMTFTNIEDKTLPKYIFANNEMVSSSVYPGQSSLASYGKYNIPVKELSNNTFFNISIQYRDPSGNYYRYRVIERFELSPPLMKEITVWCDSD